MSIRIAGRGCVNNKTRRASLRGNWVRHLSSERVVKWWNRRESAAIFRPVLYNRLIDRLVKRAGRVGYAGLASPIINFPVFKIRAPVRFARITNLLFPRTSATNDLWTVNRPRGLNPIRRIPLLQIVKGREGGNHCSILPTLKSSLDRCMDTRSRVCARQQ